MSTNTKDIVITPILGTDSLSSSRIVINDNFKILENALNNYKQFFDENGVYSSNIISKNEDNTINFYTEGENPKVQVSNRGLTVFGELIVGNTSTFENVTLKSITANNIDPVTITGNVKIVGNLSITGDYPGGGDGETVAIQNFDSFRYDAGYIECYNRGCYVCPTSNTTYENRVIALDKLLLLIKTLESKKLLQYINKPIIFAGKGLRIGITNDSEINKVFTILGKQSSGRGGRAKFYIPVGCSCDPEDNPELYKEVYVVIKIYPTVYNILESAVNTLNIEMFAQLPYVTNR